MTKKRRCIAYYDTPPTDNYVAGDIAFYDSTDDKIVLVHNEDINTDTYPATRYTPIGVVVIPNSHDVYGDGSCGVMSLMEMNCDTPDTGSTEYQYIRWGHYNTDISNLPNLNKVPLGNQANGLPIGQTDYGYLPSDKFNGSQCLHDTDVYYAYSSYIPSPYLTNGSRNPGYYQTTSPSSTSNCLADFNGKGNSEILLGLATAQSNWRTDSYIVNDSNANYLPAACCCWRYHANGTQQGDWYLPACGELGYIMPPFNKINEAINNMLDVYGTSVGVTLDTGITYWSSSEYGSNHVSRVDTNDGSVNYGGKGNSSWVRAFIRIKPDGTITSRTTTS